MHPAAGMCARTRGHGKADEKGNNHCTLAQAAGARKIRRKRHKRFGRARLDSGTEHKNCLSPLKCFAELQHITCEGGLAS